MAVEILTAGYWKSYCEGLDVLAGKSGGPYWNMPFAFRGHMVILCDQFSGSDGEVIGRISETGNG